MVQLFTLRLSMRHRRVNLPGRNSVLLDVSIFGVQSKEDTTETTVFAFGWLKSPLRNVYYELVPAAEHGELHLEVEASESSFLPQKRLWKVAVFSFSPLHFWACLPVMLVVMIYCK